MTTTVDAIYEKGSLTLPQPLALADKTPVRVTIEAPEKRLVGGIAAAADKWRGRGHLPVGKNTDDYLRLTRDGNGD